MTYLPRLGYMHLILLHILGNIQHTASPKHLVKVTVQMRGNLLAALHGAF